MRRRLLRWLLRRLGVRHCVVPRGMTLYTGGTDWPADVILTIEAGGAVVLGPTPEQDPPWSTIAVDEQVPGEVAVLIKAAGEEDVVIEAAPRRP